MKSNYSGDVPHLVQLCSAAYHVLKQVDPTIRVISPSPAPGGGPQYLRSFIEQGGGKTFDILGFHFYDNLSADRIHPESIVGTAQQLRNMLVSLKLADIPIWNTESGYYIHSAPTAKSYIKNYPAHIHVLAQQEAVDAVGRSYALAWAVGIERSSGMAGANQPTRLSTTTAMTQKMLPVHTRQSPSGCLEPRIKA